MKKGLGLQAKFSISYIAIIVAVLLLMNTYPLTVSEDLTFRSKGRTLQDSVSVMVTALSGLEEDDVRQQDAAEQLDNGDSKRKTRHKENPPNSCYQRETRTKVPFHRF